MKVMYVLIMLSGAPGPTWTASQPVSFAECTAMKEAVGMVSKASDKGGFMGPTMYMPAYIECVKVELNE